MRGCTGLFAAEAALTEARTHRKKGGGCVG
ncbi:hypothetical protein IAE38_004557, partial [Pseudomonas sp. S32]|nr:hypothetical protein [Pseudomonas sp. S32]